MICMCHHNPYLNVFYFSECFFADFLPRGVWIIEVLLYNEKFYVGKYING